jgi:hypothetical protein
VVLVRMADKKGVHGKAREVYRLTVGAEWKSGIEKNRCFSRGELNAASTNFVASLKNGDFHWGPIRANPFSF